MPGSTLVVRQPRQQRQFGREVLADGAVPGADAPDVVLIVPLIDHGVKLIERVDARHWDKMIAAEPADLSFGAALLVSPFDAWLAVEGVDADAR